MVEVVGSNPPAPTSNHAVAPVMPAEHAGAGSRCAQPQIMVSVFCLNLTWLWREMLGQRNRLGFADGIEAGAHRKRDDLLPAARERVVRSVPAPKIAQLLRVAERQSLKLQCLPLHLYRCEVQLQRPCHEFVHPPGDPRSDYCNLLHRRILQSYGVMYTTCHHNTPS